MPTTKTTTNYASGTYTDLAFAIDRTMDGNTAAQAAYLAIWGVEWVPLYEDGAAAANVATNVCTASTTATTCI